MRVTIITNVGELASTTDVAGKTSEVLAALYFLGLTPKAEEPVAEPAVEEVTEDSGFEKLMYLGNNSTIPARRVSSTARKGDKWYNNVDVGDVVDLVVTETGETFGQAVIVEKEYVTYRDAIENAAHNHVAFGPKVKGEAAINLRGLTPGEALADELAAAYGPSADLDEYTILHILPLTASFD